MGAAEFRTSDLSRVNVVQRWMHDPVGTGCWSGRRIRFFRWQYEVASISAADMSRAFPTWLQVEELAGAGGDWVLDHEYGDRHDLPIASTIGPVVTDGSIGRFKACPAEACRRSTDGTTADRTRPA
jgi:hypothetical protein